MNKNRKIHTTLKKDVDIFCKTCSPCQFTKGGPRHKTPLQARPLPAPREHLMADFLGPIYLIFSILCLVDYATGYTMFIPTEGVDGNTIVNAITENWIKIFGWFKTFESDWGSGFNGHIMQALAACCDFEIELAEPRNHRSIGKVERNIGILQKVLNEYNLILNERLTDNSQDRYESWKTITAILPFMQFGHNQRRNRFTTISPTMKMFGMNMRGPSDVIMKNDVLEEYFLKKDGMETTDYEKVRLVLDNVRHANKLFLDDYKKKVKYSRVKYNEKYKIDEKKILKNRGRYSIGTEVLYFCGDIQMALKKWKRQWTGPWLITSVLNDTTCLLYTSPSPRD